MPPLPIFSLTLTPLLPADTPIIFSAFFAFDYFRYQLIIAWRQPLMPMPRRRRRLFSLSS
jgi:hypothetical protein